MVSQKYIHLITLSELGGAQKYVLSQAVEDQKNGIESIIVSNDENGWLARQAKSKNLSFKVIHNLTRSINPLKDLLATLEIIKLLKQEQPSHIFLNSSKISFIGALAGNLYGIKNIIYTVHGWVFNEPMSIWKRRMYIFIEKLSAKWKTTILFINKNDMVIAQQLNIGKTNQYKSTNLIIEPIDFLDRDTAQQKLFGPLNVDLTNKKIIGTIANLYPTKNLSVFIDIANELKNINNLIFIIIGDGPEKHFLTKKIKQQKLNNVLLLGQIENAAIYLKAFDLFLLTSIKEGSPYVLLEAKQANIPILATPVGGVPEMLSADQLCQPNEFVQQIKTLFYL